MTPSDGHLKAVILIPDTRAVALEVGSVLRPDIRIDNIYTTNIGDPPSSDATQLVISQPTSERSSVRRTGDPAKQIVWVRPIQLQEKPNSGK